MNETYWTRRAKELNKFWTSPQEIPEYRQMMIAVLDDMLENWNDATILDCGCGTGLLYKYLPKEHKSKYYGVDFTQDMIDHCQNEFKTAKKRFARVDLTANKLMPHDILVTQNVIQHILLFQEALDNIFSTAKEAVVFCERTHEFNTVIAGYEPAFRWRFNQLDFYLILDHFARKYSYLGDVEILGMPKTTKDETDMLTIYRVYRTRKVRAKYDLEREPAYLVERRKDKATKDWVGIFLGFLKQFDIRENK